jgi:uncharacterized membrane protein
MADRATARLPFRADVRVCVIRDISRGEQNDRKSDQRGDNTGMTESVRSDIAYENIRAVARLQEQAARKRSVAERASDAIAAVAARQETAIVHIVWFAGWALVNTGHIPRIHSFDPYPFNLLTSLVSLEAIFLTLFVLGSQNRLTQEADRRAHLDLQVNLLSEQEMTMVLRMLGEVCRHLDLRETISSPKFQELARRTDVGQLAEQVDSHLPPAAAAPPRQ